MMTDLLRRLRVSWPRLLPAAVSALLVLGIAWVLAQLTWALVPPPKSAAIAYTPPPASIRPVDAGRIADQHLFGVAAPVGNTQNAPDTTLALTLHGIVAGRTAENSRALIVANGDEAPYAIGAQVPGGAVIRAIFPDRVLLERNGRVEALRLPRPGSDAGGSGVDAGDGDAPSFGPSAPQALNPVPQNLGELRQQIMNNPQRLMDVVRVMPVQDKSNGKLSGYRVFPTGNSTAFTQLGLRPGDIVTAV
ncbi:MAG TPA: type II secretion system protein GspC, partial [Gammaproteobacteria bacterium]|nr:type II secretion system protein GspC [Gammaproteobacteria bacterium]